ncbi:class I SAM-dependent methyltransferase [Campylobacter helveticus]|uniref:Methyltransferase domain-containing protein n=2 Tax=Campylobacter helveticus TaxID=28898 RepID=A0AAX2UIG1_9BACT|nr:class I SAM-dependent methyltransferase [Campylobacter helveticus]ARE79879.1 SAM-dependent methyltransferase [Campylobacter helveticus]MCR2040020.1 class I SAM-dependent methyltransferase [Campylobacter helveticus]MCR2055621.1 class I SAM-dependent methyltransferase [Campylobacter helveticus]MCR2057175.1 class I SAM-dependent methyltransferase [Campylobacter helveticus]MCR2061039.1 class I SAM-dependent methyltransferase [Campylobacter helveticus]
MNLWDKKAKTYARFHQDLNEIQRQTFKEFEKLGLDFKDKSVIDIGCGTGVWTLHLAFLAKEILALDSAKAMLTILQEDALNLKLSNIKSVNLSFEEWKQKNANSHFDIAFLSMSPALQNEKDYEDFLNLAKVKIYLGWADYRKSDFLDPIFKHFKTEFKGFYKEDFESFLIKKNIAFHKAIFEEERFVQRTREEAIENVLWHLDMNGIKASKDEIKSLVKDDVAETIKSKIKLLIINDF